MDRDQYAYALLSTRRVAYLPHGCNTRLRSSIYACGNQIGNTNIVDK
jgi:hypothetical protein